jgi:hypothetical protein
MGVRRQRPPLERSASSFSVRFPDGTVKAMPVDDRRDPETPAPCCFCGEPLEQSDPERIRLSADWIDDGEERTQSWDAHHRCLALRMHDGVPGTGAFFAG